MMMDELTKEIILKCIDSILEGSDGMEGDDIVLRGTTITYDQVLEVYNKLNK